MVTTDNILDFSKLEAGQISLEYTAFSIRSLIDRIVSVYSLKASEKNLTLSVNKSHSLPDSLVGDPLRINQILSNLLSNAIKFTENGRIELTVKAEEVVENKVKLSMEVKDTGIGIAKNNLNKIFYKFAQADKSISRKFGGTGLGLSIVKELVDLMGGRITIDSEQGHGSVFKFQIQLPISQKIGNTSNHASDKIEKIPAVNFNLNDFAILVVEDNKENLLLTRMYLDRLGCKFDTSGNVFDALEMMEKNEYRMILLDIQIGDKTGFDFLDLLDEKIEQKKISYKPYIVALTAHVHEEIHNKCIAYGMHGYLSKPLDIGKLKQIILKYIDRS